MDSQIHVLHLDDSALDAELVRERIRRDDPGPWRFEHVATRTQFERALVDGVWDLVLTDYSIPGYDGMDALREARSRQPDCPIIVISGTLSEEEAVECLQAGATDYVFKQRLQRLAPAARRALAEAEERRRRRMAEATTRQLAERLRQLAEHVQDVLWIVSAETGRLVYLSPSAQRVLGHPVAALYADLEGALTRMIHPEDLKRVVTALRRMLDGSSPRFEEEFRVIHPDGNVRWLLDSGVLMPALPGAERHASGIARDITERKLAEARIRELNASLERKVAERTAELQQRERRILELNAGLAERAAQAEAANRELEAFSYSVSHDLRAPLGAIRGFADALAEDHGAQLDERGRHYVGRIRAATARMDALIDDMLSLSRVVRADFIPVELDLTALAQEVVEEVRERDPGRRARVSVQPGMRARADARLLRIALVNLVGNAWKFSSRCEETVVEIGRLAAPSGMAIFHVRDRGAGFDPAYAHKLFGTFQRLHSESEFPGTGIGLAIVRRVIERHGGNVWAEGAPGQGATFYFSLPAAEGAAAVSDRRGPGPT